jgi:YrbI family 3-deoxy-D-manno-octulosonate 8-phosphate phosphatase
MTGSRAVAIIPARGGSKGVPGKNLRPVGGVALVARAVRAAAASPAIDVVAVTTDDDEIAVTARREGAVVIERPAELASDTATSESALRHALEALDARGERFDVCVFIQCTSPFIDPTDITATAALVAAGDHDSAFTATEHHGFLWRPGALGMEGVNHDAAVRQRRQDRDPELLETGAVYAMRVDGFLAADHRFFGRIGAHVVPAWRAVEIDTDDDLELARAIVAADPARSSTGRHGADILPADIGAVVFDFDGVMTDNSALVLEDGTEGVVVHRGDGAGIEQLRATGVPLLVITKETNPVAHRRCEKLGLTCLSQILDKWPVLEAWLLERGIEPASVVYVGNDHNDVECLEQVGCGVAVADAHASALAAADLVLRRPGGGGAVRELADLLLEHRLAAVRQAVAP